MSNREQNQLDKNNIQTTDRRGKSLVKKTPLPAGVSSDEGDSLNGTLFTSVLSSPGTEPEKEHDRTLNHSTLSLNSNESAKSTKSNGSRKSSKGNKPSIIKTITQLINPKKTKEEIIDIDREESKSKEGKQKNTNIRKDIENRSISINGIVQNSTIEQTQNAHKETKTRVKQMPRSDDIKTEAAKYIEDNADRRKILLDLKLDGLTEQSEFIAAIASKPNLLEDFMKEIVKSGKSVDKGKTSLSKDTPVFEGTHKEDFTQWLFKVDMDITTNGIMDKQAALAVCMKLKGTPLYKYQSYYAECQAKSEDVSWTTFKNKLKEQYQRNDTEFSLRRNLRRLKKRNCQSLKDYDDEFLRITHAIGNMSSGEKIDAYVEGLEEDTFREVVKYNPKSVEEAMRMADTYCTSMRNTEIKVNYAKEVNGQKPFNKNYRGNSKTFKFHNNINNQDRPNTTFQRQSNKPTAPPPPYNGQRYNQPRKFNGTCNNCGKFGHMKRSCTRPKEANQAYEEKEPYIKLGLMAITRSGLMNCPATIEKRNLEVSFDTGAEISIMSYLTARDHNVKINRTDTRIKVADSSVVEPIGETDLLDIRLGESSCSIKFIVMQHDKHQVLLGLDWFMKTGAILSPRDNTITFPKRIVQVNNTEAVTIVEEISTSEGRPVGMLGELDEEINDVGFDPKEVYDINVTSVETLKGTLSKKWKEEVIPAVVEVSAKHALDLGHYKGEECAFELTTQIPIVRPTYRKSLTEMEIIEELVDEMLNAGIVRLSTSAYNNPIMLVPKPDGTHRIVHDFRALNEVMYPIQFAIPRIQDIFQSMQGKEIFSKIDFLKGFHQMPVKEEHKKYLAFSTRRKKCEYNFAPQGVKTIPAWFSLKVGQTIEPLKSFCTNYLDDVYIYSDSLEEHLDHLILVMNHLKEAGFKISPNKSLFCVREIGVLGFIINKGEIRIDPKKIEAISKREPPTTSKGVLQCIGSFGYFRPHIKDFAKYQIPLQAAVKEFVWETAQDEAFKALKRLITSSPILAIPILEDDFIIYSDSSIKAIGGMLCQLRELIEVVNEFWSRMLKGAELNYPITELEMLALYCCVKHWQHFLYGRKCIVYTDHMALIHIMAAKEVQRGRLGRAVLFLQSFNLVIKYIEGPDNKVADFVSRPEPKKVNSASKFCLFAGEKKSEEKEQDMNYKGVDPYDDVALLHKLKTGKHLSGLPKNQVKRVDAKVDRFRLSDTGKLFYLRKIKEGEKGSWREYPEKGDRKKIIEENHALGHFLTDSTKSRIEDDYFWKGMEKDIKEFILRCLTCQRHETFNPLEHPAKALRIGKPFEIVHMDMVGGLPETVRGNKRVLIFTMKFLKVAKLFAVTSKEAEESARCFWLFCCQYGPPKMIISDQGKEFINGVFERLLKLTGTDQRMTSAYNPRSNGMAERANQTVMMALRKCCETDNLNWDLYLPFIEYCYNTKKHSITGFSPFELLFGVKPNKFIDFRTDEKEDEEEALAERSIQLKKLVDSTRAEATVRL